MLRKHILKPGGICTDCGYENVGKGFDVHYCDDDIGYKYEDEREEDLEMKHLWKPILFSELNEPIAWLCSVCSAVWQIKSVNKKD